MRKLLFTAALVGAAFSSFSAGAVEVCDKSCVGPVCEKNCVREPDAAVGRRDRDIVIEEERTRRPRVPEAEIREPRRPGVEVEVGR